MLGTAVRLEAFGLNGGLIDRVFLLIFDVSDLSLELGAIDSGPAFEQEDLVELGVVVSGGIRLMGHSE